MEFVHDKEGGEMLLAEDGAQVMMEWEKPYMEALVDELKITPNDRVLEIGFGCGYSATHIQSYRPRSHTIIEISSVVIEKLQKWAKDRTGIQIVQGSWQEKLKELAEFDCIFFDDFPLDAASTHTIASDTNESKFSKTPNQTVLKGDKMPEKYRDSRWHEFLDLCINWHLATGGRVTGYLAREIDLHRIGCSFSLKPFEVDPPSHCLYFPPCQVAFIPLVTLLCRPNSILPFDRVSAATECVQGAGRKGDWEEMKSKKNTINRDNDDEDDNSNYDDNTESNHDENNKNSYDNNKKSNHQDFNDKSNHDDNDSNRDKNINDNKVNNNDSYHSMPPTFLTTPSQTKTCISLVATQTPTTVTHRKRDLCVGISVEEVDTKPRANFLLTRLMERRQRRKEHRQNIAENNKEKKERERLKRPRSLNQETQQQRNQQHLRLRRQDIQGEEEEEEDKEAEDYSPGSRTFSFLCGMGDEALEEFNKSEDRSSSTPIIKESMPDIACSAWEKNVDSRRVLLQKFKCFVQQRKKMKKQT